MDQEHEEPLSPRRYHVKRRGGIARNDGINYETYMYLLILIRLMEDEQVKEFHIAQNVDEVGAFDDIVVWVRYGHPSEVTTTSKMFLIQLKHKDIKSVTLSSLTGVKGNGDFKLLKYFDTYKMLKTKIGNFKDKILNRCNLEDMKFIIYTNAHCVTGNNDFSKDSLARKLFETGESGSNVFSFISEAAYDNFFKELMEHNNPIFLEADGCQFLQSLIFFSTQKNTIQLQEHLLDLLKTYVGYFISPSIALQRASKFVLDNTTMWVSQTAGVLRDITFDFQGRLVTLSEIEKFWDSNLIRKLLIIYICHDKHEKLLHVGTSLKKSEHYYIERTTKKWLKKKEMDRMKLVYKNYKISYEEKMKRWRDTSSLVLLCASPGMGKTSFISHEAYQTKKRNPEKFIIKTNLIDFSNYLNAININKYNAKEVADKFLLEISGVSLNSLEFDVIQYYLKGKDMLVLYLDGVDEIGPQYLDKVIIIIKTICKYYRIMLWISTRPIIQKRLENELSDTSWTLNEFTEKDTIKFIKSYCGVNNIKLGASSKKVRGIPIFCRMLGDIINTEASAKNKKFLQHVSNDIILFDTFINVMYEKYYKEKEKADIFTPAVICKMEKLKKVVFMEHEKAAVLEVFNGWDLSELKWTLHEDCQEFLKEVLNGEEKLGLIANVVSGTPRFMHRTIAEYFCGRWFANNKNRYEEFIRVYNYLPKEVDWFMSVKLNEFDNFFLQFLMKPNNDKLYKFLRANQSNFNTVDSLGRNFLHYSVLMNNVEAFKYILCNGVKLTEEDVQRIRCYDEEFVDIFEYYLMFEWFRMNYKKYLTKCELIGLILTELINDEKCHSFFLDYSENLQLHNAILRNKPKKIKRIIRNSKSIINVKNKFGLTAVHFAVWKRDIKTLELLSLEKAAYTNDNALRIYPHQLVNLCDLDELKHLFKGFPKETQIEKRDELFFKMDINSNINQKKNLELLEAPQLVDPNGRTVLHIAAAQKKLKFEMFNDILLMDGLSYVKDVYGLYPHDYATHIEPRQVLYGFGFACGLQDILEADRIILGLDILHFISKNMKYTNFARGLKAKMSKVCPPN